MPRLNLDPGGAFEIDWTRFDAATHIADHEEELPHRTLHERERRMEWFTFAKHAPAYYFVGEAI